MLQYAQDYDERLPSLDTNSAPYYIWYQFVQPYVKSTQIFQCPSDPDSTSVWATAMPYNGVKPFHTSYIYNTELAPYNSANIYPGKSLASINSVSTTVAMTDGGVQGSATAPFVTTTSKPGSWVLFDPTTDPTIEQKMPWAPGIVDGNTDPNFAAPSARHLETCTVAFLDGHVKSLRIEKFYFGNTPWLDPARGG